MSVDAGLIVTAFGAGLLGSAHCVGMCGPLVTLLEQPPAGGAMRDPWWRRAAYQSGRAGTYATLGVFAGGLGASLGVGGWLAGGGAVRTAAALALIAMAVALIVGGRGLGAIERGGAALWRRVAPLARHVLPIDRPSRALGAGMLWGLLPCGLVYTALGIAALASSWFGGALVMLSFWLGTLPALVATGTAAERLRRWRALPSRRRLAGVAFALLAGFALFAPHGPHTGHEAATPDGARHEHHGTST